MNSSPPNPGRRRIVLWSHALPDALLDALNARGFDIVALIQGHNPRVRSFSIHDLFAGGAALAQFEPRFAPPTWLDDTHYRSYARCVPRMGFYPGSDTYETISGGIVDPIDIEDWARLHLNHAWQLLDGVAADEVWFTCPPHLGADQMMARAAQCSGRKLLITRQLRIANKFVAHTWSGTAERTVAISKPLPWTRGATSPDLFYMAAPAQRHLARTIPGLLLYLLRSIWSWQLRGSLERYYLGARRRNFWLLLALLELGDARTRPYAFSRWIARHRARRAAAAQRQLTETELPSHFVYFPLHLEPEMNTTILGRGYTNQLDAIVALHAILPPGWKLLLKENPKQGYLHRGKPYWQRLNGLSRVNFVSAAIPSDRLIAGARVVATITGTAGYEALLAGKPSIYFGDAWYEGLPGTTQFSPGMNLEAVACQQIDRGELDAACNAVLSPLADGLAYPGYASTYDQALAEQTADSLSAISAALRAD